MIAVLGLVIGVVIGLLVAPDVPEWAQPYLPIAVVAALDAVFGALRAFLDGIFDDKVFVVSFVSNVLIAALIVYLGDQLGVGSQLSTGVVVVLALVACMAVVQVRVNRADDGYQNARREDLIAILDGLGQNTRRLESEIAELEERKNSLSSSADKAQTAREQAEAQVRVLGILAGTLPATGPGVRITLNDPEGKMTSSNLLDAIEELRDAGAEAIQINGSVRVVASTDFVDDAPGIRIDGQKVTSPYVIEAIGESHNLAEAANFPGGLVSEVTGPQVGGTAEVNEQDSVQITALHAPEEHRYARPAPSPTK